MHHPYLTHISPHTSPHTSPHPSPTPKSFRTDQLCSESAHAAVVTASELSKAVQLLGLTDEKAEREQFKKMAVLAAKAKDNDKSKDTDKDKDSDNSKDTVDARGAEANLRAGKNRRSSASRFEDGEALIRKSEV